MMLIKLILAALWGWYAGTTFDEHAALIGIFGAVMIAFISSAIPAYGEVGDI